MIMGPYGTVWILMALYGSLWHPVDPYGTVRIPVAPYGSLWHRTDSCGTLWIPMALCGSLWHPVDPYGTLWISVVSCGSLWVLWAAWSAGWQPCTQQGVELNEHWGPLQPRPFCGSMSYQKNFKDP